VKTDQIDILARTMFRHLEEIDYTEKPRLNRQRMSDILNRDLLDGIHLDFTSSYLVTPPTLTCGRFKIRTLQVIDPLRTPSRSSFVKPLDKR